MALATLKPRTLKTVVSQMLGKIYPDFVTFWQHLKERTCALSAAFAKQGSLPSFAAQSTNGRNAENRPFAALVANVSVADKPA